MLSRRYSVFTKHALLWFVVSLICWTFLTPVFILFLTPLALVDLWLSLCLGLMFRIPAKRRNKQPPGGWKYETFVVEQYPVRWLLKQID